LAIEGTHNFIANGIVAHNTYLGDSTEDTVTVTGNVNAYNFLINGTVVNGNTTGAGTTNYVSKWLSGSQLGDSLIYDNGTFVGIGTTTPQNLLNVAGDANVTGLCVAEDSLISMADGTKKEIKDIKAGEEVLSLDEGTGEIVSNKVIELLDMGEKAIYEMTTKSGRSINTTAEHPYLTELNPNQSEDALDYSLRNSLMNSFVVNTLTNDCSLRCGSLDHTLHFNFNASAAKSTSFLCEMVSTLGKNSLYSSMGTNSINIANFLSKSLNSFLEIPVFRDMSLEFLLISSNANSGAKNSKSWSTNIPFVNESFQKKVNNTFESTTNSIHINPFAFNSSYLPCLDALCNLTDQSIISLSSSRCLTNLCSSRDNLTPDISICSFNSLGNSILISMNNGDYLGYLNVSSKWIEVRDLKVGDEIAVPDSDRGIKWEKIVSIEQYLLRHGYDLAIENMYNFIANGIVAHNTYFWDSVSDVATVDTSTFFVDAVSNTPAGWTCTVRSVVLK
ncbi:MAG: hypothetical protein KKC19_01670, partial [Nanoarchaeota archaeon]|nr:hypothetical protein [Nanoarchaeota archaeon]